MKIPNKKWPKSLDFFYSFRVKIAIFPLKWHVLAYILGILRNFKAENRKKLRK